MLAGRRVPIGKAWADLCEQGTEIISLPPAMLPFGKPLIPAVEGALKARSEVLKLGWRFGS